MVANKQLRRGRERGSVDLRRYVPHPPQLERWEDTIIPNSVAIRFADGRKSGMKTLPHVGAPQDTNRRYKVCVQSEWPLHCRYRPLRQFNVRTLRQGMHAGIGSTSAVHAQRGARDRGESLLQVILNRVAAGLALPSSKGCTVIRDDELQPRWHLFGRRNLHACLARRWPAIEITLKDHLGCDLVDNTARLPCFDAAVA